MSSIMVVYNEDADTVVSGEISGIEFLSTDFVVRQASEDMPPPSGQYALVGHRTKDIIVRWYGNGIYRIELVDP